MRKPRVHNRTILLTIPLVLLLTACFIVTTVTLQKKAQESCYTSMESISEQAAYTLQYSMELNRYQLYTIAEMLPQNLHTDPDGISQILNDLCATRVMSALFLQLPDGTVLQGGNPISNFGGLHSFSHDKTNVPYISDIIKSQDGPRYVYQAVPILRDGETAGILYGFLNLKSFPSFFKINAYGGQCQLYIIDGNTGDFLMDTWHTSLGNAFNGEMGTAETKPGYDLNTMRSRMQAGLDGYMIFRSQTTGDWFYTHYRPTGINNWSIQITVPEQIAFADAQDATRSITILAILVIVLTGAYLLWILLRQYRDSHATRQQLQQTDFMYQVQQILFNAYEDPDQMILALERVSQQMEADASTLIAMKGRFIHKTYTWVSPDSSIHNNLQGRNLLRDFPRLYQHYAEGLSFCYYTGDDTVLLSLEEKDALLEQHVSSILSVPLLDSKGELQGLLCTINAHKKWPDCAFLEIVAQDFARSLRSMDAYQLLHNMGMMDSLTGLKNRNSFESSLIQYASTPCCILYSIYIDVNGLHEINNLYGHSAGDSMLRTISGQIRALFGDQHTYRIGGDEFALFLMDMEEEELLRKISELKQSVLGSDYHISVGYAAQSGESINIDSLLLEAEERMYRDKQLFYQQYDPDNTVRQRDNRMDRLLQSKRDTDNFLELISSHYGGIYIINLKKDTIRTLYNPGHFAIIMQKYNFRYTESMRHYVQEYVVQEDRQDCLDFCSIDHIRQVVLDDLPPKLTYRKIDGIQVCIRIYPTQDYSADQPEVFWFFEKLSH